MKKFQQNIVELFKFQPPCISTSLRCLCLNILILYNKFFEIIIFCISLSVSCNATFKKNLYTEAENQSLRYFW